MAVKDQVIIEIKALVEEANRKFKKLEKGGTKSFKKIDKATKKTSKSMAAFTAKLLGAALVLRKVFKETKELTIAQIKQAQVLKSTGQIAGISAKELEKMAAAMQKATGLKKADILNAQSVLLTFTKIGKEAFPKALEAAADMSVMFGQDLKQSIIQLGTALNSPIEGVGRLRRIGISFSDEQKKQIEQFVKQNDLMSAQGVILKELQVEFGGVAKAINQSGIGTFDSVMNQIKDIMAELGQAVLPMFIKVFEVVGAVVKLFGSLPQPIKAASIAVVGLIAVIAAFALSSPIGVILGFTTALAGLFGLMNSGSITVKELDKANKNALSSLRDLDKQSKKMAQQKILVKNIKSLKKGTVEYKNEVKKLLKINPDLARANITVKSSYDDIAIAANNATNKTKNQIKAQALLIRESQFQNITKSFLKLSELSNKSGDDLIRYNAQWDKTKEAIVLYTQAAVTTGMTVPQAMKKAQKAFGEASGFIASLGGNVSDLRSKMSLFFNYRGGSGSLLSRLEDFNDKLKVSGANISKVQTKLQTTTGKGSKKDEVNYEDELQKLKIKNLEGFHKKREQLLTDVYKRNQKFIKATNLTKQQKTDLLNKSEINHDKELKKLQSERNKKNEAELKKGFEGAAEFLNTTMKGSFSDIATFAAKKMELSFAPMMPFFVQMFTSIFDLFGDKADDEIDQMADRLQKVLDSVDLSEGIADMIARIYGEESPEAIESALANAKADLKAIAGELGVGLTQEEISNVAQLLKDNESTVRSIIDTIIELREAIGGNKILSILKPSLSAEVMKLIDDIFGPNADLIKKLFKDFDFLKLDETTFDSVMTALNTMFDLVEKIEDLGVKGPIAGLAQEMATLQHEIATGVKDETQGLEEQIGIYDDMLLALEGVLNSEELIMEIEEERYRLQQQLNDAKKVEVGINEELFQGAQGQSLQKMITDLNKLRIDIEAGRIREGSREAVLAEESLLQWILANLAGQGVSQYDDTYVKYANELAGLGRSSLGSAYSVLSGQGVIPTVSQLIGGGTGVSNVTNNSVTNNQGGIAVNGQSFQIDDVYPQFLSWFEQTYGINLAQGA